MKICLSAPNTLGYPDGGHLWVFINWALGFRSLGHEVYWLDVTNPADPPERVAELLATLRERLTDYGLADTVCLCTESGSAYEHESALPLRPLAEALAAEFLCDHRYNLPGNIVGAFRRSALVDIDPGQFQVAVGLGTYSPAPHNSYFTVGEWVKFSTASPPPFDTLGLDWQYIPPPVPLDAWPQQPLTSDAPFTTVSNWFMGNEWMPDFAGQWYDNAKRAAFQDYLHLPRQTKLPMELCLNIGTYQPEIDLLQDLEWRVVKSPTVSHPKAYQAYIQQSLAEFSCAKPAYVRMRTGWLSDRTVCYLASGRPVVIQKTGESDLFPDDCGMFRFTTPAEAARGLEAVASDPAHHSRAARAIAEEHLDAKKVLNRLLEIAMS